MKNLVETVAYENEQEVGEPIDVDEELFEIASPEPSDVEEELLELTPMD